MLDDAKRQAGRKLRRARRRAHFFPDREKAARYLNLVHRSRRNRPNGWSESAGGTATSHELEVAPRPSRSAGRADRRREDREITGSRYDSRRVKPGHALRRAAR